MAPDGSLARAGEARVDTGYRCPGCASPLLLRRGEVRAAHFAHQKSSTCSPETALHVGVKTWIAAKLERRLHCSRARLPRIQAACSGIRSEDGFGREWRCPGCAWYQLSDLAFDQVALEQETPDGLRPDVLLLHRGTPVLAIEVLVTHAVDSLKAARTTIPWVELDAGAVVASPWSWRPRQLSATWRSVCRACAWALQLGPSLAGEVEDTGEYLAQLGAMAFASRFQEWLNRNTGRSTPTLAWRCPWCRSPNRRRMDREKVQGLAHASSLGPPILPAVILRTGAGAEVEIGFGRRTAGKGRARILPLAGNSNPALRVVPDLARPLQLTLLATNRPLAFVCKACGRDCLGLLPSAMEPVPWGLGGFYRC